MKPERTETTNNFNYGFTISEDELRRINTILTQQMKLVAVNGKFVTVFRLQFKNKITGERNSVDQVLAESNAGQWKIQSLEIELYDDSIQPTQIMLTFKKSSKDTIGYHIEGTDRNWVFLTKSLIDDRIKIIKQLNTEGTDAGCLLFGTMIASLAIAFVLISSIFDYSYKSSLLPTLIDKLLAFSLCILFSVGVATYLYSFPSCNFFWGDNIRLLNKRNTIGKFILGGILLALVINIVSGIAVYFITAK